MTFLKGLGNKLLVGVLIAVAVFVAMGIYADFSEMAGLLQTFRWELIPLIFALTLLNYGLRFGKWHYYLWRIGVTGLTVWDDFRIFFGGFSLSLTPGKAGELIRLWWIQRRTGDHPAKTAPVAVAERLTDGLAMALLVLLAGFVYPNGWRVVLPIGAVLLAAVIVIQIRPLALWLLDVGQKLPLVSRIVHHLHVMYDSAYELLSWKNLLVAVGLGVLAWSSQGVAFFLVLVGLGEPPSTTLLFQSIFILAFATVAGGASGVPGGLGVTEGGLTGLLRLVVGVSQATAATAALMIRFFTMWFGVSLGLLIVFRYHSFLFGDDTTADLDTILAGTTAHQSQGIENE